MKSSIKMTAVAVFTAATAVACASSSHSSSQASPGVMTMAASPVTSDVSRAMTDIVGPCLTKAAGSTQVISCIEGKMPPSAMRDRLGKCLADGYSGELARSAFNASTAYQVWKKDDIRPCMAQVVR